jgi:ABC-type nitrate/sulfonate/bicarbonate transport system ATPase subunit
MDENVAAVDATEKDSLRAQVTLSVTGTVILVTPSVPEIVAVGGENDATHEA